MAETLCGGRGRERKRRGVKNSLITASIFSCFHNKRVEVLEAGREGGREA